MATESPGLENMPGGWMWVNDSSGEEHAKANNNQAGGSSNAGTSSTDGTTKKEQKRKHWGPRTCRICLETVLPTFHAPSDNLPSVLQGKPYVTYESEAGRLLSPCQCKGSSRYVHESCLQEWRHADPAYGKRNFWRCPICNFQYRLERLNWGKWVSSTAAQLLLTSAIFVLATFLLGFLADPIINLYLDPWDTLTYGISDEFIEEDSDWATHFIKGFASLGVLGFVKAFLAAPIQWITYRGPGAVTTRRAGTSGRERVAGLSWVVIMVGVVTFLITVWKGVSAWSKRLLKKAGEKVIDVQGDEADESDES